MIEIIFASTNKGKIQELQSYADKISDRIKIISPLTLIDTYGPVPEVEEGKESYVANASLKAKSFFAWCKEHYAILSDDTGIEVGALNGRPGVLSARFAGENATADKNNQLLLSSLQNAPSRNARFLCVLVLITKNNVEFVAKGTLEGTIATSIAGTGGFGYDSLFCPIENNSDHLTLAQLKERFPSFVTHRKKAFQRLFEQRQVAFLIKN